MTGWLGPTQARLAFIGSAAWFGLSVLTLVILHVRRPRRAVVTRLLTSAEAVHHRISEGGPDTALDAIGNAWYSEAARELGTHLPDELPGFEAPRTYRHVIRRGMTERQVYLLQWLEDRIERLREMLNRTER